MENDELVYTITCKSYSDYENKVEGGNCFGVEEKVMNTPDDLILISNIEIDPNYTHEYEITVKFKEMSVNQDYNQGKRFSGTINVKENNNETPKLTLFRSSAKMMINSAEKLYAMNKENGIEEEITCEDINILNKNDYSSCKITFDNEEFVSIELAGYSETDALTCNGNCEVITCDSVPFTDEEYFTFNSATGEITDYNDTFEKDVVIPPSINGVAVTSIGNSAFFKNKTSNSKLTKIINKTGRSFNWGNIINSYSGYSFATGTVTNTTGNVSITSS